MFDALAYITLRRRQGIGARSGLHVAVGYSLSLSTTRQGVGVPNRLPIVRMVIATDARLPRFSTPLSCGIDRASSPLVLRQSARVCSSAAPALQCRPHRDSGYFEAGGRAEAVHRELSRQMDVLIQGALDYAEGHALRQLQPDHRRGAGGGGRRRLRPRRAGAAVRHRPPVPAPLQAHAARRADAEFLLYGSGTSA